MNFIDNYKKCNMDNKINDNCNENLKYDEINDSEKDNKLI
jgi:hypothetical protein